MDDLDIEMGDAVDVPMEEPEFPDILPTDDQQEEGEVEEPVNGHSDDAHAQSRVPNKIHLRGVDTLTEDQVKAYIAEHFGGEAERIEWIDDSSLNLVFGSDATAQEALVALSAVQIADPTQLQPLETLGAKPFAGKREATLQVRFAIESDKKQRGAAERSRFYLLNPDWDPTTEEGRRRKEAYDQNQKRRYRDRDGDYGRSRRGGRGGRRDSRYDEEEPESFDVNLYDDDADAIAKRAPRGYGRHASNAPSDRSTDSDRLRSSYVERNRDKELFPSRKPRDVLRSEPKAFLRNRSASPNRDDDVDQAMKDLAKDREAVRNRQKAQLLRDNLSARREAAKAGKDTRTDGGPTELFPSKVSTESRKPQMDQVAADEATSRLSIADRITQPSSGINIRGLASQTSSNQGMAIKGTSVRELFPHKFSNGNSGNTGKELFADKLKGRGRRRQKAEDTFH